VATVRYGLVDPGTLPPRSLQDSSCYYSNKIFEFESEMPCIVSRIKLTSAIGRYLVGSFQGLQQFDSGAWCHRPKLCGVLLLGTEYSEVVLLPVL
jgi:hypothetical protein